MTQSVHNISFRIQNLLATAGFGNHPAQSGSKLVRRFLLTFLGAFAALAAMAQTYTTKADGAWNSASTWVGGVVPANPITAGKIVVIKHDVTFDLNADLSIAGTLHIEGDTLRFASSYDKKVVIASTGLLTVKNGGFLQDPGTNKGEMIISGGRVMLDNAKLSTSGAITANPGTRRSYKNSTVLVSDKYTVDGTSALRSIDTIQASSVTTAVDGGGGDIELKAYTTVRVANARISIGKGKFKNSANCDVTVLSGAVGNYGFNVLRIETDLENDGAWDARIDAFCIGKDVKGSNVAAVDFTRPEDCSNTTGPAPELTFQNPVLKSGTANKEGAVYRFSNVSPGVDAEVKLKKFSRSDIKMNTIDNSTLGWGKAFQPEFGLAGVVPANQNWYIDFEMTFFEAGKNKKVKMDKVDFTALDVDGDGFSVAEYAQFSNPANVAYSTVSSLTSTVAGALGSLLPCATCLLSSALVQCTQCKGAGIVDDGDDIDDDDCTKCLGSGALHSLCGHPYKGMVGNILQGTVQNFNNIDTAATQVMATYQFANTERINFRYGAKTTAYAANGSGIRLNSLWSKSFSLAPWSTLPVKLENFSAALVQDDANLTWKASHGEELKKFVIQRSTDGKIFTDIATVLTGNTANYGYKDNKVNSATGVVYYRVGSVDYTNEVLFSDVKMLRLAKTEQQAIALSTFPNPVVTDVRITLPAAWQGKQVMLQLYSANGTIAKSIQLGAASQTETMPVGGLIKGLYVVKAMCGEEWAQQRIIKN